MPPDDDKPALGDAICQLSQRLAKLDPGSLARLRRMDPKGPGEAAFWKLAIDSKLKTDGRYQILVRLMALLTPKGDPRLPKKLHDSTQAFGAALAEAGYPETRLMRFLALPFAQRAEALERMARWLAQKGHAGLSCTDIESLLISDDEKPARKLAESYYRTKDKRDATKKDSAA